MFPMPGFIFFDPSIRLAFSLAIGLSLFNISIGFVRLASDSAHGSPTVYMFVPGILGGWVLKICFFLLMASTRPEAQIQAHQLICAAAVQALVALALTIWLMLGSGTAIRR